VGWIDGAAAALEASVLGTWARGSAIGYPLANLAHLLGLVLLIGPIGLLDLRMAGLFRDIPLRPLARATVPLAAIGLLLLAPSGLVMFAADATALVGAPIFQWKLAVIGLALLNVAAFYGLGRGRYGASDQCASAALRLMAVASLALWLTAAALGRMIAYQ
jgi:hypothetical protein